MWPVGSESLSNAKGLTRLMTPDPAEGTIVPCQRKYRSKRVAHAKQRSQLLKDSAGRIVWSGNDLLSRERREIVPEFRPQEHVRDQTDLHASAGTEDDLPYIVRCEAGDLRNRLRKRRRTGDDIFLRSRASGEERPPTMLARLEVEQQPARQRVRIALYVGFHSGGLQVRVAVVIEVVKLSRHVI